MAEPIKVASKIFYSYTYIYIITCTSALFERIYVIELRQTALGVMLLNVQYTKRITQKRENVIRVI